MGKGTREKHSHHRTRKLKQGKGTAAGNKSIFPKQATKAMPNKWNNYILRVIVSIALCVASNFGANMLNDISPIWGYLLLVSSFCIVFGYWAWKAIGWIAKHHRKIRLVQILATGLLIVIIFITSPYYKDYFIKSDSSIEMPTFVNDSTQILVHYGTRANDYFWTQTTIGELKQKPSAPFSINGQQIFTVYIEQNKLYIDTVVFAGYGNQPVVIKNNAFSRKPDGWKIYQNSAALEILNENDIPVLILEYHSPYEITISGLFVTPMGICKVDNSEGNIFLLGDTLSELGTYKVDRVFIHSIFDLFRSERIYNLK